MSTLTDFDKKLLNKLQTELPVCSRPFKKIADDLGSSEEGVIERLNKLKAEGYLRKIGTFFNSDKLGYTGTLVALEVEPAKVQDVAEEINKYNGATHNYEREGKFNLWFTLITPDESMEKKILTEVETLAGVKRLINLKAKRKYKINVSFKLK